MAEGEEAATEYAIGWEPQPGPQTALLACPVFEVSSVAPAVAARRTGCLANGPLMLIFTERTLSG